MRSSTTLSRIFFYSVGSIERYTDSITKPERISELFSKPVHEEDIFFCMLLNMKPRFMDGIRFYKLFIYI